MQKKVRFLIILITAVICIALIRNIMLTIPQEIHEYETITQYPLEHSEGINPGECVEQSFTALYDNINGIGLAIAYDEENSSGNILINILDGDSVILEQSLPFSALQSDVFLPLMLNLNNASGRQITIRITNTSENGEVLSVPIASDSNLYPEGVYFCKINGQNSNAALFFQIEYFTGYYYYTAICYCFWILISGIIISAVLCYFFDRIYEKRAFV